MFTILNRLRGEYGYFAKINGIILGLIFGYLTNPYIGIAMALGYVAGESMGWGEWIGQLLTKDYKCGDEGESNGIKYITSKFFTCGTRNYNILALAIRGIYWWLPALAPLYFVSNPLLVTLCILTLGIYFPFCTLIANNSVWFVEKWLSEKLYEPTGSDSRKWRNEEYLYGLAQDVCILLLVLSLW